MLAVALFAGAVRAADPAAGDADAQAALDLADQAAATPHVAVAPAQRTIRLDLETAGRRSEDADGRWISLGELAADLQVAGHLSDTLSGRLSARAERFDDWPRDPLSKPTEWLVREAYLEEAIDGGISVAAGRVDDRLGAAVGWNPTDFLRAAPVRLALAPNPDSRRLDREGSVMLRMQSLWRTGGLAVDLSPQLAGACDGCNPIDLSDLQRTNGVNRVLVEFTQRIAPGLQPQWILYKERDADPRVGMNVSAALGDAVVVYAEWVGSRGPTEVQAIALDTGKRRFASQLATGATLTLPTGLSLTVEWQYNGAGASASSLRALAENAPALFEATMATSLVTQELPTRHALFAHADWHDIGVRRLDASAFVQADLDDHGRQEWVEVRRRFDRFDIAVQWQQQQGPPTSRFGASLERRSAQLSMVWYL